MIWTQIFKNHYFAIYNKYRKKWIRALSENFVDILSLDKTP